MPLRFLHYLSDVYREMFSNDVLHRRSMIKIPVPHFVTFYNGLEKWIEEEEEIKLSDMYEIPVDNPQLELKVRVININKDADILSKCETLRGYMTFVNKTRCKTQVERKKEDDAKAVITTVSSEKASDGSPVVIFEYNIPAGYHIDFAGVLAHKTLSGESLTVENGAYVIGDSDLSYTTYRYTVKSKSGVTWNIKPMLKYTYNGKTYTIYGNPITLN